MKNAPVLHVTNTYIATQIAAERLDKLLFNEGRGRFSAAIVGTLIRKSFIIRKSSFSSWLRVSALLYNRVTARAESPMRESAGFSRRVQTYRPHSTTAVLTP